MDGTKNPTNGNLINHCACGKRQNLQLHILRKHRNIYHLVFVATRGIKKGAELRLDVSNFCEEEIKYYKLHIFRWDYGDRKSEEEFMKNCCPDLISP